MDFITVALSICIFSCVAMCLVALITFFQARLIPQTSIKITLNQNQNNVIEVAAGSNLLSTLSNEGIFLPSACGGGGTCAMCKCQILSGVGDILPTEAEHFTRQEIKENWRLSCQVKAKNDMEVLIPDEIFNIQKFSCKVRSNENVASFIKELVLDLEDDVKLDFEAGGYIQIYVPEYKIDFKDFHIEEDYRPEWDKYQLWNYKAKNEEEIYRAYSMANHPAEGNCVKLNVRIATPPPKLPDVPPGVCSSYIFNLKEGDEITLSGPYGEFFVKDTSREMVYIGGGAGMAPLRSHIFHLFQTLKTGRKVSYWYGARSLREMFYADEFKKIEKDFPNFSFNIGLSEPLPEDNWNGYTGFIHQIVLDNYLLKHDDPTEIEYYLCGPPMMISSVQKMLYDLGVEEEMIAFDDFG